MAVKEINNKAARQIATIVDEFRKLDSEMQAQQMLIYLHVMSSPDITMRELEERVDLTSSSVSRNIAALSKIHRKGKAGHNLVETYEDPEDRRYKRVRPTGKGRAVFSTLLSAFTR